VRSFPATRSTHACSKRWPGTLSRAHGSEAPPHAAAPSSSSVNRRRPSRVRDHSRSICDEQLGSRTPSFNESGPPWTHGSSPRRGPPPRQPLDLSTAQIVYSPRVKPGVPVSAWLFRLRAPRFLCIRKSVLPPSRILTNRSFFMFQPLFL
jgi:hypothetical protein